MESKRKKEGKGVRSPNAMKITEVRIRKLFDADRLRAIVSITIDDVLAVHDLKIIQGPTRLFVAMPSRKDEHDIYRDVIHPITSEGRRYIEKTVLEAYENELRRQEQEEEPTCSPLPLQEPPGGGATTD